LQQKLFGGQVLPGPAGGAYNASLYPLTGFREYRAPGKKEKMKQGAREEKGRKGDGGELCPTRKRSLAAPLAGTAGKTPQYLRHNRAYHLSQCYFAPATISTTVS